MDKLLIILSLFFTSCHKDYGIDDNELLHNNVEEIIEHLNNPSSDYVMVASHRGDWQSKPENTIPAIESCISKGVDIVEIDVRRTLDGHLVVIHDSTLERTTNGRGDVKEKTLEQIKTFFVKDRFGNSTKYKVPTLTEVMRKAKGKILVMIDKANDYFEEVLKILTDTGTVNHAVFIEPYQYDETKEIFPADLFNNAHYIPRVKENVDRKTRYISPFILNNAAVAFELRFSTEDSHVLEIIPTIQTAKISIWITTLSSDMSAGHTDKVSLSNPKLGWGWCIERGANILMTDYPIELVEYLKSRKLH